MPVQLVQELGNQVFALLQVQVLMVAEAAVAVAVYWEVIHLLDLHLQANGVGLVAIEALME
ncbi:hypothetical protein POBR111598_10405 [Polynucleobacter brandtiae]